MNTLSSVNTILQHLAPLQLTIEFRFQAHQPPAGYNSDGSGLAGFTLLIGDTTYGPYLTSFRTTHAAWMMRTAQPPTAGAVLINVQIALLTKSLWDAWKTFPNKKSEITGEMILNRAGLNVFSVATGGALYVI